jgi:hypothetical protein
MASGSDSFNSAISQIRRWEDAIRNLPGFLKKIEDTSDATHLVPPNVLVSKARTLMERSNPKRGRFSRSVAKMNRARFDLWHVEYEAARSAEKPRHAWKSSTSWSGKTPTPGASYLSKDEEFSAGSRRISRVRAQGDGRVRETWKGAIAGQTFAILREAFGGLPGAPRIKT